MEASKTYQFSPSAQLLLKLARDEAERLQHNYAGTEHLLLGILKLGQGVAINALRKQRVDLDEVGAEMARAVGAGPETILVSNPPYTPRFKKVLALAGREAKSLDHTHIGTEHLLLGLLAEGEGIAAKVLQKCGAQLTHIREEIVKELDPK